MGIGWSDPTHGRLVGGPWIVAIPAYSLSFKLMYIPAGDCWEGVDAFTAWAYDAAGNTSSQSVLIKVGNQPSVVDPASLEGTATATLTPTGVELSPAVMKAQIEDPDGDEVYVKEYCPAYAANLTLAYGSLNVTYWPRPYDYCRVLREGDAVVDEFTLTLCGGQGAKA